ncbi:MAG: Methylated-DNA--protein-cysteine methyltransferase [Phycisphaerae bacterium]|nr:Methylated-DNA--protein-cysteine methyltransferase [Phycisphaerae bacterium]
MSSHTHYALVPTSRGVAAILFTDAGVTHFVWPASSSARAADRARALEPSAKPADPSRLPSRLAARVADYFAGREADFSRVPLDLADCPPFQARVLKALAKVGYGRTVTYGQLARRVGRPGGARAVGQAMARNPIPVIVPCHRVLRSDGGLGGFSADEGVALKDRLLAMERAGANQAGG